MFNRLCGLANGSAVIALGGMTARRAAMLSSNHIDGWAGIDAFRKNKSNRPKNPPSKH
jgi:hypothetical protein